MHPPFSLSIDPEMLKPREAAKLAKTAGHGTGRWKGFAWTLPFVSVEGARVVELSNEDSPEDGRRYAIENGEAVTPVRYDHGFAAETLAALGPAIARANVCDYIRFYMAFTRGQSGRVLPVDDLEQLPLREELTLITRRKMQSLITPLTSEDTRKAIGCFLIGDKLFRAKAVVEDNGHVTLTPQSILADTLPVLDESFDA